ncbi:hypothetical protein PTKIN_Ptkin10aG0135600 [Pterospermum kingtungense]
MKFCIMLVDFSIFKLTFLVCLQHLRSSAMQEELDRFNKQQKKCQSMLTNTAPVKFSNDTERLQHINSIRKASVGGQMKRVIDLLFRKRQALTPEQINDACYVDVSHNKDVFEGLRKNPKVNYDGNRFFYKAKHNVKNKHELFVLIRKYIEGIAVIDLKDANPKVMDDLQALKAAGEIWLLSNFDSEEDIAFPRVVLKVDDDLKKLFRSIDFPQDMLDVEEYLLKNGMKPATKHGKRRADAQVQGISSKPKPKPKQKNKNFSKKAKLTNAHLPELFLKLKNSCRQRQIYELPNL